MAAERIQDCFWFRSLFHIRTVLTGRFRQPCDKNQALFKITVVIIKQPERVRNWFSIIPVELNIIILNNEHVVFTFRKDARFSMVRKTHVFLSRETVTVKNIRPWVSLAGKHWGTAFPHCHTQTTAGLDETEQIATLLHSEQTRLQRSWLLKERIKRKQSSTQKIYLRVKTNRGNEGAEEGLCLRVAACLQQRPPILWMWHHLAFQATVAQKVWQTHLWVSNIFADMHLVGNGNTTSRLTHVKCQ